MSDRAGIEWTDATWNPLRGCSRVSEGCRNCYAERIAARFSGPGQPYEGLAERTAKGPRWTGKVALIESALYHPLRWRKPRRIFVNSMSDLFHQDVPDEWIDRVFAVMALAPQHTFQVLTKRPERMGAWFATGLDTREEDVATAMRRIDSNSGFFTDWPLPNVWLGTSIEDQPTADARIPHLLATPAAVRFVSAEPLLGPVNLGAIRPDEEVGTPWDEESADLNEWGLLNALRSGPWPRLDWLIVGGESGPGARPMHPDWARSLRDQCAAASVPFFFKQWGEWAPWDDDNWSLPDGADDVLARDRAVTVGGAEFLRVGKTRAGRLLDGHMHDAMPGMGA